ncbi:Translation initiation factor 2 [Minicystis rosea]|nr:Translation initiation factor 2 [Minicystis rosea]
MHRATVAFVAVLVASFSSGCGRYYYRHRVMYAVPEPAPVMVAVRPAYAPPPPPVAPPPPAAPRTIVVHAPPGSVVIVNPGRAPVVRRQVPVAPPPVAPASPEVDPDAPAAPDAPSAPVETDEGWFNGG